MLIGNGDGSFQSPAYYAVSAPVSLAAPVDLNGDGYPDVAVSTLLNNASGVAVLLNQGSAAPGTLSTAKAYPGPTDGESWINGCGRLQRRWKAGHRCRRLPLAVYYGNGDGTLQAAQTTPGGPTLVTADFNHDGLTDVAYHRRDKPDIGLISLQVLLGASSGKFTTGMNLPLDSWLGNPGLFIAGTTNGGSNVDLALVGNYTSILLGDGKGGFTYGNSYDLRWISGWQQKLERMGRRISSSTLHPAFLCLRAMATARFRGL